MRSPGDSRPRRASQIEESNSSFRKRAWTKAAPSPLQIDACDADDDPERCRQVPQGGFAGRFFVAEWNAFIHFAALDARLIWLDVN